MNYNQPYYGSGMMQNYGYQPMYQSPNQNLQTQQVPTQVTPMNTITRPTQLDLFSKLQGKSVDSIDVVKATDIPLDGSISYFPLTDNSAIITKQLMPDGTSKTMVYKPIDEQPVEENIPKYVTVEDLDERLKNIDNNKDLKEDIKSLKKQLKDLSYDFDKLNDKFDKEEE